MIFKLGCRAIHIDYIKHNLFCPRRIYWLSCPDFVGVRMGDGDSGKPLYADAALILFYFRQWQRKNRYPALAIWVTSRINKLITSTLFFSYVLTLRLYKLTSSVYISPFFTIPIMFFAVRPGYDFLFSRKCSLSLSSLKRVCKLELGSNDYVSRRIGKPIRPFSSMIRNNPSLGHNQVRYHIRLHKKVSCLHR